MMLPSWQAMHDLVVEGKLDTGPLERAAADIMVDPEVQRLAMRHLLEIAQDERAWRVGALLADAFLDALTDDPGPEPLVDKMLRDPRSAHDLSTLRKAFSALVVPVVRRLVPHPHRKSVGWQQKGA